MIRARSIRRVNVIAPHTPDCLERCRINRSQTKQVWYSRAHVT